MQAVPEHIMSAYVEALFVECIPTPQQGSYKKWLRYYWDFCHKYQISVEQQGSLPAFVNKLQSKQQSTMQCEQAQQAIMVFYALCERQRQQPPYPTFDSTHTEGSTVTPHKISSVKKEVKVAADGNRPDFHVKESTAPYQQPYAPQNANWMPVYEGLKNEIQLRHYSPKTLSTYQRWMRQFQAFVKSKDSHLLSQQDVKGFLTHLAVEKKVAASTQNQAFNALLFLFKHVLKAEFGEIEDVPRAKRHPYVPVVLSRAEIDKVLSYLPAQYMLPVQLLYGCGLRISECLNLRLQDFNLEVGRVTVHRGKGKKDRTLPLPQSIMADIQAQIARVATLYDEDLAAGYAGVFLPDNIEGKYPNAAREFSWQWFFPAKTLTFVNNENAYRRYHLHDSHLQKAIKHAVKRSKLTKRASAHTFRHSFASHLIQAHYDIRTVQELMGHSDVKTTMIYLQTVPSLTLKEAKSPLDFVEK